MYTVCFLSLEGRDEQLLGKSLDEIRWRQECVCLVAQSFLTLCDPMDCSPPGSSIHGDSPGKDAGAGCFLLLQGIFQIQGSNLGLHTAGGCLTIWATSPSKNKLFQRTSQVVLVVKNSPSNTGDTGLISGAGRSHWQEATKSLLHNYSACALEPRSCNYWTHPQTTKACVP